jgi:predicted DNA-binding antitoxin AbrB/MazE fold protein
VSDREKEPAERLEELLKRLEGARARLEVTDDPEQAVEVLRELAEVAKEVQAEIERARREEGS